MCRKMLSCWIFLESILIDFPFHGPEFYQVSSSYSYLCRKQRVTIWNYEFMFVIVGGRFGEVNQAGISFYNNLIDALLLKGNGCITYQSPNSIQYTKQLLITQKRKKWMFLFLLTGIQPFVIESFWPSTRTWRSIWLMAEFSDSVGKFHIMMNFSSSPLTS